MSLSHGRTYLAIPGPSVMPDAVLEVMHRAAPNIYAGELVRMMPGIVSSLRGIAGSSGDVAMYVCNGHGTWEAALTNTLAPGDTVLIPATGYFGHGWATMAEALGLKVEIMDFGTAAAVDPDRLEAALRADKSHAIKAVLATHVDTSSSIRNDMPAIRAAMDAAGHPALLMADCIASLACDRFEMDAWGVDVTLAASQKGLMTPPGMGFLWINDKARAARADLPRVSRYWDWTPRVAPEELHQYFGGTAPTHHVLGLRKALDMIEAEGLEAVWARHERLARGIWAACDAWASEGALALNVTDPACRSHAVTSLALPPPYGTRLRNWCERKAGVTLGIGLGMAAPGDPTSSAYFRIGHMGHVNAHMVLGVLGVMEAGMKALGIPHGDSGVSAAAEVMSGA